MELSIETTEESCTTGPSAATSSDLLTTVPPSGQKPSGLLTLVQTGSSQEKPLPRESPPPIVVTQPYAQSPHKQKIPQMRKISSRVLLDWEGLMDLAKPYSRHNQLTVPGGSSPQNQGRDSSPTISTSDKAQTGGQHSSQPSTSKGKSMDTTIVFKSQKQNIDSLTDYVVRCMTRYGLCTIDNFLGEALGNKVLQEAMNTNYVEGKLASNYGHVSFKILFVILDGLLLFSQRWYEKFQAFF